MGAAAHFPPRPDLKAKLEKDSKQYAPGQAFPLLTVHWDEGRKMASGLQRESRECLCIYTRHRSGDEQVLQEIRDDDGEPRQIHEGDVEEALGTIIARSDFAAQWQERLDASQSAIIAERDANREDMIEQTCKELWKVRTQAFAPQTWTYGKSDTGVLSSSAKARPEPCMIIDPNTGFPAARDGGFVDHQEDLING